MRAELTNPLIDRSDEVLLMKLSISALSFNVALEAPIVHPWYHHAHSAGEYLLGDPNKWQNVVVDQILPENGLAVEKLSRSP